MYTQHLFADVASEEYRARIDVFGRKPLICMHICTRVFDVLRHVLGSDHHLREGEARTYGWHLQIVTEGHENYMALVAAAHAVPL